MTIRRLLEAQKYMLFAYTSCGWFFSDVSGIETVQSIAYAGRALQLGIDKPQQEQVTKEFVRLLSEAKSNIPEKDGAAIFKECVVPFLHHLEILCFASLAEKAAAPDKADCLDFNYFGYRVALLKREHAQAQSGGEYDVSITAISNHDTGEHGRFAICLARSDGQIHGWCVPADVLETPGFNAQNAESFATHPESVALDLSYLFEESKVRLSGYLLLGMYKDTQEKYASWMERNEESLNSLSSLGVLLPPFVVAPIAYVLTSRWNSIINGLEVYGREDDVWTKLLDLWTKTQKYNITLDYSESARLLLDLLVSELKIFTDTLSEVSMERIRYFLNIVDRFTIPFSKNKTEDMFFSTIEKTLVPLYDEFKKKPDSEHRHTIVRLLQFARRMNFNTDAFPVF